MKVPFILIAILVILCHADRRIVSRPIKSTYNQYGKIQKLIFYWNSYEPIFSSDYLKVTLPEIIHDSSLMVGYSLTTAHSLNIISSVKSLPYVGSNTYFFPVLANLTSSLWYQINIWPTKSLTMIYGLVQIQIVSKTSTPNVMHSWNNGFEYYHLQQDNVPSLSILQLNINNTLSMLAADRYMVLFQIKSSILVNQTVDVTIDFADFNVSSPPNITIDTAVSGANKGFIFVGSCFARCDYGDLFHSCIHSENCQVTLSSLTITLPYMRPGEIYLIQSYVINPPYVSSVGVQAYYKDNGGRTTALAFGNDLLQVLPIVVQPQQIRLLWDIPYSTVTGEMDLGLFVNDPAVQHQSLSSFDIGFSVSAFTPIEGQYEVKITVGASSVLQSSINHNLPSLKTTTNISCRYAFPNIVCTGVDAFSMKNYRYFVRARGNFLTTDNLAAFGDVTISIINQPANYLFANLVRGMVVRTIVNSDYHDYGGLHQGSSNFRIGETLVVSHNDTLLPNSTSNSIIDFLYLNNSIVGVDASVSPQQLQFFLKVGLNQMSLANTSLMGQNFTMKLYTNPHIMNTSNLGLQFTAYSSVSNNWDVMNAPCYVDSSTTPTTQRYMCQKYSDHVYNRQIDNTYSKTTHYGLYMSVCGSGLVVTCPSGDCADSCRILRGGFASTGMQTGTAGVLSIRNVTFVPDYQSPVQAGRDNFDFVLAFYQQGIFVSASLINAYTFNRTRLQNIKAQLINYYHDNVMKNQGNRIPTLLKVSGHLTLQQAGKKLIKSLRISFPTPLSIQNFVQSSNSNSIGCSTNKCIGYLGGLSKSKDGWTSQNSVLVSNLPSLTQQFIILFPVVYETPEQLLEITISLVQFDGKIGGVFRVNGSSVNQSLSGTSNHIALPWTPVTTWTTTATQWVNQPSIHAYKQNVDLTKILPYSAFGNINMGATVMPTTDLLPSTTFASAYMNIFSNYSYPTVDGSVKCVDPFPYTYQNSYRVWTLWCPILAGAVNQIKFNYPLYPSSFGTNFPYNMIFSYIYSNSAGRMIGYRVEQGTGGSSQACTTQKSTTYDKNTNSPQQNEYAISLNPFTVSAGPRNKFRINLSIPTQIPMTFISCRGLQSSQSIPLACSIVTQSSNVFKLQLVYSGSVQLQIYQLKLFIKSVKSATSTIASIQQYNTSIELPFTDSSSGLASFLGTSYTPYLSIIASCSNSFTYSAVSSQQFIYLSKAGFQATSVNYYGKIWWTAGFSSSRTTFFDTSSLVITFSEAILTSYSRCQLFPNTHFFSVSTVDATNKVLTLISQRNIQDFTLTSYDIICTQIIPLNLNPITISMLWKDSSYNIQTTFAPIAVSLTGTNGATSAITGTLVSKLYNTPGYLGEYIFNFAMATTKDHKISINADFPQAYVHETFLECLYLNGTVWVQVACIPKSGTNINKVYIQFVAVVSSNIQIRIFGIHQAKLPAYAVRFLLKRQVLSTGVVSYMISSILDQSVLDLSTPPIIVYQFNVDINSTFTITYSMPALHNREFFIRVDERFRLSSDAIMACKINSTIVDCKRTRPQLILINSTLSHGLGYINIITITYLNYFYGQKYDTEQVHFSMFIATPTRDSILYGSHEHLQDTLLTSALVPPQSLIWQIPNNYFNSVFQIVYVGYYGAPAKLVSSTLKQLKQSFTFNVTNSLVLSIKDMNAQLGTDYEPTYLGTLDTSILGYHTLGFTHNSSYWSISGLPVYVSSQKCALKAQYSQYNIFNGGVTIPIFINISACRPMEIMNVQTVINTPLINSDQTLTTKTISYQTQALYIVLSHRGTNLTLGQSFQLKISLLSANSIVQNSFSAIPNVTINIIDRSLLIGNPEAKQPVVNQITQNSISLGLQCNTPATIYWGIGLYPTMLGITFQEVEARLIDQMNGLVPQSIDIYSWSHEIYGLNYVNDFNIYKNITINGLQGGLNYVFKYFCVDQTGTASGGKISQLTTLPSNYSLMKITLTFDSMLNYSQVNSIACAMSEQLVIPYNETISSIHSNCLNNTQVYHKSTELFYDYNYSNKSTSYGYFFYIETYKVTTRQITSNLVANLGKNRIFVNALVPYYSSIRSDSLLNDYQPVINDMTLSIKKTQFTISVKVGLANTYLIAALMDQHFNPTTMSLPTHYLMKQGYFSLGTKFDMIYSIYGRNTISVTFKNLSEGSNFSVFYFVTVDNSALNSRHSQVKYRDLVTSITQIIDLHAKQLMPIFIALFAFIWLL